MSASAPAEAQRPRGRRAGRAWLVVLLLFLTQMLNYFDKTVIGIAAGPIMSELRLTPQRYGLIASAFFSLYAVSGLLVAFLAAPRVRPRFILAVLLLVWAVAQAPVLLAASFGTLLASRVILGVGEGPATPTTITACHEWFPSDDRNMPTALVLFGAQVGSLVAAPVLSYVIAAWGWRAAFLSCGAAGLGLLVLWLALAADGPHGQAAALSEEPTGSVVRQRDLWTDGSVVGIVLAGLAAYWVVGFTVAWLPLLVRTRLGVDTVAAGWVLSVVYATQAALLLGTASISQRMLRSGRSSRTARGKVMAACLLISGAAFASATLVDAPLAALTLVAVGTSLPLGVFTLGAAMVSEIAPTEHRNRLVTIIFSVVTLSAIPSPLVAGALISGAVGWNGAFLVLTGVTLLGGAASWFTLRPDATIRRLSRLAARTA